MRVLMGAYRRHDRLKQARRRLARRHVVRHDSFVDHVRPHTKTYGPEARKRLGVAVMRAREALGHQWRPSFAAIVPTSVASLFKLETGRTVGPSVYEAVARKLPGWTEDTPRLILEGGEPPEPIEPEPEPDRPLTKLESLTYLIYLELRVQRIKHEEAHRIAVEIGRLLGQDEAVLTAAIERESHPVM